MTKTKFIILRAVSFNGSTIEKDRYMGDASTRKKADDIVSIFNDDIKSKHHALKSIDIKFYVQEFED